MNHCFKTRVCVVMTANWLLKWVVAIGFYVAIVHKDHNDWVSACRDDCITGASFRGMGKKTWGGVCQAGLEVSWFEEGDGTSRSGLRDLIYRKPSTYASTENGCI